MYEPSLLTRIRVASLAASAVILLASPSSAQLAPEISSSAQPMPDKDKSIHAQKKRTAKSQPNASVATTPPAPEKAKGADASVGPNASAAGSAAQNPIAAEISIPLQNNTGFGVGPYHQPLNDLVIEPVIPFKLGSDWNLITRWITPVIYQPRLSPSDGEMTGIGNLEPQFYFSPANPGPIIWGVGPQAWLPTASGGKLGVNRWGGGPAAVAVTIEGPWLLGVLAGNVWAGAHDTRVNETTLNPFVFYNLPGGWYLMSSPIMTADWTQSPGQEWTVPLGGGVGRTFSFGGQALNARVQLFDDVVRPRYGPRWQMQFELQFLFPAT